MPPTHVLSDFGAHSSTAFPTSSPSWSDRAISHDTDASDAVRIALTTGDANQLHISYEQRSNTQSYHSLGRYATLCPLDSYLLVRRSLLNTLLAD